MRNYIKYAVALIVGLSSTTVQAGNPDRIGESGATHLIINPWARSSGWAGANTSGITGIEAMRFNIGGMVHGTGNEVGFARTNWLQGADININAFGFKTMLNESSAMGITLMTFDLGDFVRTTVASPDGTLGSFTPSYTNLSLGYSHKFSDAISGGMLVRFISEAIPDVNTLGLCIDAGVQYRTGSKIHPEQFKLGFALRNVGPAMKYTGNGLDVRAKSESDNQAPSRTLTNRSAAFELPSILNIGLSYDFYLDAVDNNTLTLAGNFVANSFGRDNFQLGLQYSYRKILELRTGLSYETAIFNADETRSIYMGPSAGASFNVAMDKDKKRKLSIDYSFRQTRALNSIHTVGAKITF